MKTLFFPLAWLTAVLSFSGGIPATPMAASPGSLRAPVLRVVPGPPPPLLESPLKIAKCTIQIIEGDATCFKNGCSTTSCHSSSAWLPGGGVIVSCPTCGRVPKPCTGIWVVQNGIGTLTCSVHVCTTTCSPYDSGEKITCECQ